MKRIHALLLCLVVELIAVMGVSMIDADWEKERTANLDRQIHAMLVKSRDQAIAALMNEREKNRDTAVSYHLADISANVIHSEDLRDEKDLDEEIAD